MKKGMKVVTYLLILCMMVSIMPTNAAAAKKIKLSKKSLTLYVGSTKTLKLKGTKKKPKWSSSKKSVVTVTKKGKIKAKKKGTAVITAKLGKKKYKCKVTVKKNPNRHNPPMIEIPTQTPSEKNPTVPPTQTSTVAGNYQKLANYLMKNGTYDSDEKYYYIGNIRDTETSASFFSSITYNLDGSYEFSIMYTGDDSNHLITLTITPPEYAKGAVANIFVGSSDLIYADGEVILSSLTQANQHITYTSTNASTASERDDLYELGEVALELGLLYWSDMIEDTGLGLSLKDLGFTSYVA